MTYDQVIDQLENHLLTHIDNELDEEIACDECAIDSRGEECRDATVEAINLALIVLRRAQGKVSVPEMLDPEYRKHIQPEG